jgi:predicted amidohydrolase
LKMKAAVIQQRANDVEHAGRALAISLEMIDMAMMEKPDLVVLPECIYPGYFLGKTCSNDSVVNVLQGLDMAIGAFCMKAQQHKIYLIVGAPEMDADCLFNSAYLIDPAGRIVGTARKSFLWHFDSRWFSPSADYPVFETALGRIGMIVCADGRQPEISRVLALKGAQIIVDVTNWVTTGADPYQLSNPQYEYMLPSRAVENKVWYIAANKVGMEAESIVYCGKSCIISPNGYELAVASSCKEEIITAVIDPGLSDDKYLNDDFHVTKARRPQLYQLLLEQKNLPVRKVLQEKVVPAELSLYASTVQLQENISLTGFLAKLEKLVPVMALQNSRLLVFPELACLYERNAWDRVYPVAARLAKASQVTLVIGTTLPREEKKVKAAAVILPTGERHFVEKCHLDKPEQDEYVCGTEQPVLELPFGRLGVMMGYEGLIPEVARCLMLKGADLICWLTNSSSDYHRLFARTRAAENKLYILVCNGWGNKGCGLSLIANPGGNIIASAFREGDQVVSAQLELAAARYKTVVPGTNLVENRQPQAYNRLTEVEHSDD